MFPQNPSIQVEQNPIPQTTVPLQVVTPPVVESQPIKKSVIVKIIQVLVYLLSVSYIYKTIAVITVSFIAANTSSKLMGIYELVHTLPFMFILPVISLLMFIGLFYVAAKSGDGSKKSFWMILVSAVVVPVLLGFVVMYLVAPLYSASSLGGTSAPQTGFSWLDLGTILSLSVLVLLIFSYKKYQFESVGISLKAKIFLIIFSLLLAFPALGSTLYFFTVKQTDHGYSEIQNSVQYHVYRPNLSESGLAYSISFAKTDKLVGATNSVRVAFSVPLKEMLNGITSKGIMVTEGQVPPDFDPKSSLQITPTTTLQEINFPLSKSGKAFLTQKPLGDTGTVIVNSLFFITQDNILIQVSGAPRVTSQEVIDFAKSMY